MKKIMFSGLPPDISEEAIKKSLGKVGPVHSVSIVREGDPDSPVVVVEMDISDVQAYQLTTRVTDFWHDGQMINAHLLLH